MLARFSCPILLLLCTTHCSVQAREFDTTDNEEISTEPVSMHDASVGPVGGALGADGQAATAGNDAKTTIGNASNDDTAGDNEVADRDATDDNDNRNDDAPDDDAAGSASGNDDAPDDDASSLPADDDDAGIEDALPGPTGDDAALGDPSDDTEGVQRDAGSDQNSADQDDQDDPAPCEDACVAGTFACSQSALRSCIENAIGCLDWSDVATCSGELPLCDATAGRCSCGSSTPPRCAALDTPTSCKDGEWLTESTCPPETPVCVAGERCQPCTQNADCPASACHFLGPHQGTCFDTADVHSATNGSELTTILEQLSNGSEAVIRLAPGTYEVASISTYDNAEISLIGETGVIITRTTTGQPPYTLYAAADSYLYLSNLTIADGGHRAIGQASTAKVRLENVVSFGHTYALYGPGDRYIYRSRLTGTEGAIQQLGGVLRIENSSLGPGAGTALTFSQGEAGVDIRYVSVVGNALSISCSEPYPIGIIRNSILVGTDGNSIGGTNPTACRASGELLFVDNAVDQAGYGTDVGNYDPTWFRDPDSYDFHLSESGRVVMYDIADWDEGDVQTDIDGELRPDTERGYPGLDE